MRPLFYASVRWYTVLVGAVVRCGRYEKGGIKKSDGRKRKRESRRGEGEGKENEDKTKMRQRRNKDEARFMSFSSICPIAPYTLSSMRLYRIRRSTS